MRDLDLRRLHRDGSHDRRQHVGRADSRLARRGRRDHRLDGRRHRTQAVGARARRERGTQGRRAARIARLHRHRRPRGPRHGGEPGHRGDARLGAHRRSRQAVPRAGRRDGATRRPRRRVRERKRPAARLAPRDHRAPLRLPHVLGRGRDHACRRSRADALRRLAARRDEAARPRGAALRGGGEVPHARRADPARDVHQLRRPAGSDDLHEPSDRGDVRLPGRATG